MRREAVRCGGKGYLYHNLPHLFNDQGVRESKIQFQGLPQ